ncbi:MAG: hypothetical protein JW973_15465 [Bacteroidales bacterium]|nr:hypothetical protein [Bacteroidales bacterium]
MITTENYFEAITGIDFAKLPEALRNGDKLTRGAAQNDWSAYNSNENIKRVVDAYLLKLNEWTSKQDATGKKRTREKPEAAKKKKPEKTVQQQDKKTDASVQVEKITPEIAFIRRYVGLNGKTKDSKQILGFINALQKAIVEKRIRKTSSYAKEIENIQEQLIACYEKMGESVQVNIDEKILESYSAIAYSEKAMLSVAFIKQFIGLHGKKGVKEKAQGLSERINKALKEERIAENDQHISELRVVIKSLQEYLEGKTTVPEISSAALNGLMEIAGTGSKKKVLKKPKYRKNLRRRKQRKTRRQ